MNYNIPGWMTVRDLEVLSYLASCVPDNGHILEVGPFLGRSTSALVSSKKDSVSLDVIDTFKGVPVDSNCFDIDGSREKFNLLRSLAIETGDWEQSFRICQEDNINKMNVFKDDSQTFKKEKTYDFSFIDANHSFQSVFKDIEKYIEKNGILAGDDYIPKWPGVPRAVNMAYILYNRTLVIPKGSKIWILVPDDSYWKQRIKEII